MLSLSRLEPQQRPGSSDALGWGGGWGGDGGKERKRESGAHRCAPPRPSSPLLSRMLVPLQDSLLREYRRVNSKVTFPNSPITTMPYHHHCYFFLLSFSLFGIKRPLNLCTDKHCRLSFCNIFFFSFFYSLTCNTHTQRTSPLYAEWVGGWVGGVCL